MCVCVCVCMYVRMYICMYIHHLLDVRQCARTRTGISVSVCNGAVHVLKMYARNTKTPTVFCVVSL